MKIRRNNYVSLKSSVQKNSRLLAAFVSKTWPGRHDIRVAQDGGGGGGSAARWPT